MYIYFIRHGETEYNRKHIHQNANVPLSERGRAQVLKAAERIREFPITKIITSDYERAKESSRIIASVTGLEPEESSLFREVKRPSVLYEKKYMSPTTALVGASILSHLHNSSWHFSDEENLFDLKTRVKGAVEFLKGIGNEHEHVAVVSHGFIITLFIKYMCEFKDVRIRDYLRTFISAQKLRNASISTVAFSDDANPYTCDWICINLNDHLHLEKML